jgi:hypothetical protein
MKPRNLHIKTETPFGASVVNYNADEVRNPRKKKGQHMNITKTEKAKKEVIKILTEEKPKDLNISKERIEILASNIVKNYLTKKKG